MFTGIITHQGRIAAIKPRGASAISMAVEVAGATGNDKNPIRRPIKLGASIACNGVCLTVVEPPETPLESSRLWFDLSPETLERTTAGQWREGDWLNLERPLAMGDELGGHMVSGHVDGTVAALESHPDGEFTVWWFELPPSHARLVAEKGSITIDGISLTVNHLKPDRFAVAIIPHTAAVTSFSRLKPGDRVNIEYDLIARTIDRLIQPYIAAKTA